MKTPTIGAEPVTMSVKDTADYLGISLSAAYDAIARGEIPVLRIGRRILVKRNQLLSMVLGEAITNAPS